MSVNFFEAVFSDIILDPINDTQICCPFPHKTASGIEYYEQTPSAGINISKGLFHCFSCERGYNETTFCAAYLGIPYGQAVKFLKSFKKSRSIDQWKYIESNISNDNPSDIIKTLHIAPQVVKDLHLGYKGGGSKEISIPIVLFGQIMDVVTYRPGQTPKYIREKGSISGLPCPFDLWQKEPIDRPTLICAGEKDMMKARSYGFNAISFTGGEPNVPEMFLNMFKNREVYIAYDNDEPGRSGSKSFAASIKRIAKSVHVVDLSPVCKEPGEDLYDFFNKYNRSKNDLIQILENTPEFTEEERKIEIDKQVPLIELSKAMMPNNINKTVRSNIQVIATVDSTFLAPTVICAEKFLDDDDDKFATMAKGEQRSWYLDENYKDLFYLIDSNLKEKAIESYIKTDLLRIPFKEKNVRIDKDARVTIYKAFVTDCFDDINSEQPSEFLAYSINNKLENGKRYLATYKLVPHPQDGQKLIMVIKDVEETNSFLDTFKVTDSVKEILKNFQVTDTFETKFSELINKVKGIVKADYNEDLLTVIDLWYHTVLQFNVGSIKNIRGYLDEIIIGESRIGKSTTAAALREVYQLGKVVSLAGASATMAGLIGGSDKVGGSYRTRAGLIPQNNKGALIFEELVKCKSDLIKELTDIRSSNRVRIARVNGSIELPAYVRMLTLTNPRTDGNIPKPINAYPNGIAILTDVIGTAEDIARYDILAVFGFEATKEIDPFFIPPEPYPDVYYQTRIQWIWSRKPEQIIISKEIYQYTILQSNELNKTYGSYINIFGVEAWKKILRLAVAVAGYVVSTDDSFENIIVQKVHIDKAIRILVSLYDNNTFKLREYAAKEKQYTTINEQEVQELQTIYSSCPALIEHLRNTNNTNRANIMAVTGGESSTVNKYIASLSNNNFIRMDYANIVTTPKFAKAYVKLNKTLTTVKEVTLKWS